MDSKLCVVINLLLLLLLIVVNVPVRSDFPDVVKSSEALDELLAGIGNQRYSRDSERNIEIWQAYEFGTGVGNREELVITNIETKNGTRLSEMTDNYQCIERDGELFLAGSSDYIFSIYKLDLVRDDTIFLVNENSTNKILSFKFLSVPNPKESQTNVHAIIHVILAVETPNGASLRWYRFTGQELVFLFSWPVELRVERLQYFHYEKQNRLLVLKNAFSYFGQFYSPIDIYGFSIDGERLNLWLSQRLNVMKTFDLQVCPTYQNTVVALKRQDDVVIYEYKGDKYKEGLFRKHQNVTSYNLRNVICFETGYIRYLAASGPETAFFDFFEGEFNHDSDSEDVFNDIGETTWIESIPVDTYREESILLVQLKNSKIIALSWKGNGFKQISLPNFDIGYVDLSKITVIPKYGFVYKNKLVKIETKLRELPRPVTDDMEKMLQMTNSLAEILRKQELIINETKARFDKSYFVNPEVTGIWNITEIEADSAIIKGAVSFDGISLGSKTMTRNEFFADLSQTNSIINDLELKLLEVRNNLVDAIPIDSTEVNLSGDLTIDGDFQVLGTMSVSNLKLNYLNGYSINEIENEFFKHDENIIIQGKKTFDSIDAENLNVMYINDIPVREIVFGPKKNYTNVDFSNLNKLKIEGNVNFAMINDVNWETFMRNIVLKSGSTTIPGTTIVEGDVVAENVKIDYLNRLRYPDDYILANDTDIVEMTGEKIFDKLSVESLDLDALKTINGVPIDEYVVLNGDRTLTEDITFNDVIITESLVIDGNVTGLSESQKRARLTLNETSNITADTAFENLKVIGYVIIENSFNGTDWSILDDLISKDDQIVEITGHKTFLSEVHVESDLNIESGIINGHPIDEFLTTDTDQELPNLEKISGNVSFGEVTRGDLENLKNRLMENLDDYGQPQCLSKVIVFKVPPIVDILYVEVINGNTSAMEFSAALNRTFRNVNFQNLEAINLRANEILPVTVNGHNFEKFRKQRISKTKPQILTGNYEVEILETESLNAEMINGVSVAELKTRRIQLDELYYGILNGSVAIDTLTVNGSVTAAKINGEPVENIYDSESMGTVVFHKDVYVENLIVDGYVNKINFTEYASDAVRKNDENIVISGAKIFGKISCEIFETSKLNGKSVDYILDPNKHQVIAGSVQVNGSVTVLEDFELNGTIGETSWQSIQERFKYLGNNTYSLSGDLQFVHEDVEIENLFVTDSIQGVVFDDFLDTVVYQNSKNVTIYGPVTFKNSVTIDGPFVVTETLNDLDLKYFYDHAVRVDRPFAVKRKVAFAEDIVVEKDLIVDEKFEAKSIGNVDVKALYDNAVFVDRPKYFSEPITLENVIFESDIVVNFVNDLDMSKIITLNTDQTFTDTFNLLDIAVGKLDIDGTVNGHELNSIYNNTFMLTGEQYIPGLTIFHGKVHFRHDFDASLINDLDPTRMISLDGNETLIGNFVFVKPLVVGGNFNNSGKINGIDLTKWEATGVTKSFPIRQIVKGSWTIHGNVRFDKNIYGNDLLNGVSVRKLVDDMHRHDVENELIADDAKKDLGTLCEDLRELKHSADNQIYKYKFFDYLQIMNFDRTIVSIHHFESDGFDYLLVNFDTCNLDIFVFTGTEFVPVTIVPSVGQVESWFTFQFEDQIYFLTVGKYGCDRNTGNLWKIADDYFVHVKDFGNVTDAKKITDDEFLLVIDDRLVRRSIIEIYQESLSSPKSDVIGSQNVKFLINSREIILFIDRESIQQRSFENETVKTFRNSFGTKEISSFRVGIYEREIFVYYDGNVSEEYLFISDNNLHNPKILQTIKTHRPSSLLVINFDGLVENFLIFVENHRSLRVYEYRGIEGFVYRETIDIKADKIYTFKVRRYLKFAKRHCIAIIQDKRLVILEAKMYGEKLDMGPLSC